MLFTGQGHEVVTVMLEDQADVAIRLAEILEGAYHSPDLGNLEDPVQELIYISLTRQTHQHNAIRSWKALQREFSTPEAILHADEDRLRQVLKPSGFARQKAQWVKASLARIAEALGSVSLDSLSDKSNEEIESFLISLPGINIKSAKCIMMYSMGRTVLPVDTHLRRIAERVGLVPTGLSDKRIHMQLEELVPPNLRRPLHVNAVAHGREVCVAKRPRCTTCPVRFLCHYGLLHGGSSGDENVTRH